MHSLRLVVCVKQVPATKAVRLDPQTHALVREGVPTLINPPDEFAMETALRLREAVGGTVTALSMGPAQAEEAVAHCLRMGADEGVLLTDARMAGSDTLATSRLLAAAIRTLGFDVVLCGRQAADAETAQVGPGVAELLGAPVLTHVVSVQPGDHAFRIERESDEGIEVYQCAPPLVLTVTKQRELPRTANLPLPAEKIQRWSLDELGVPAEQVGLTGSPTRVIRVAPGLAQDLPQADYPTDAPLAERLEFVLSGGIRPKPGRVLLRDEGEATARCVVEYLDGEGLL